MPSPSPSSTANFLSSLRNKTKPIRKSGLESAKKSFHYLTGLWAKGNASVAQTENKLLQSLKKPSMSKGLLLWFLLGSILPAGTRNPIAYINRTTKAPISISQSGYNDEITRNTLRTYFQEHDLDISGFDLLDNKWHRASIEMEFVNSIALFAEQRNINISTNEQVEQFLQVLHQNTSVGGWWVTLLPDTKIWWDNASLWSYPSPATQSIANILNHNITVQ